MKSIYQYSDHKIFLKDWFLAKKQGPSGFSYQKFSEIANLGSPNYMKMVIEGRRNLTVANIHQVAHAMRLSFEETQYFEALTLLGQGKNTSEKSYFRRRLRVLKSDKPAASFELDDFNLIARWYFPAVTVVLNDCDVNEATEKVREKTGLGVREINEVIAILKENQVLREEDGKYKLDFSHFIVHDKKMRSEANKSYFKEQLKLSTELLEKKYSKGPKFYAHTFTITQNAFAMYADKVDTFITSLAKDSDEESPDEIVQLNMQLFKLLDR